MSRFVVSHVEAAFVQQIFDLAQRQREANIHHHRKANDLGRRIEIAEGILHATKLRNGRSPLKPVCSDKAGAGHQRLVRIRLTARLSGLARMVVANICQKWQNSGCR